MRLPLYLAALALSGCTSIVATTVAQLEKVSPLSADPADFAIQITLPEGLDVTPGTAMMTFSGRQTRTSEPISKSFVIAREGDVFRFADSDLEEIRAFQAQFIAWETANPDESSGSIGVMMDFCGRGDGPSLESRVSISIQTVAGGGFLPLVRNAPLSAVTDPEVLSQLGPCP